MDFDTIQNYFKQLIENEDSLDRFHAPSMPLNALKKMSLEEIPLFLPFTVSASNNFEEQNALFECPTIFILTSNYSLDVLVEETVDLDKGNVVLHPEYFISSKQDWTHSYSGLEIEDFYRSGTRVTLMYRLEVNVTSIEDLIKQTALFHKHISLSSCQFT
jgi:hypothetical protein